MDPSNNKEHEQKIKNKIIKTIARNASDVDVQDTDAKKQGASRDNDSSEPVRKRSRSASPQVETSDGFGVQSGSGGSVDNTDANLVDNAFDLDLEGESHFLDTVERRRASEESPDVVRGAGKPARYTLSLQSGSNLKPKDVTHAQRVKASRDRDGQSPIGRI